MSAATADETSPEPQPVVRESSKKPAAGRVRNTRKAKEEVEVIQEKKEESAESKEKGEEKLVKNRKGAGIL